MDPEDVRAQSQRKRSCSPGSYQSRQKEFTFDQVFDSRATQLQVFDQTVKPLCEAVIDGYNATVLAYGATGAGKTHTMIGEENNGGIMYHTMNEIFQLSAAKEAAGSSKFKIGVSFLEIYNETIRDLISPSSDVIELREDPRGVKIAGITEIAVESANDVHKLLVEGNLNRVQEATVANETSSRSHAIFQITCEQVIAENEFKKQVRIGKFSLVDLAGSERAA
jgi:kinesin family member 18/19